MRFAAFLRPFFALALVAAACSAQAVQGQLGFSVAAETDGVFSTTLKKVTISGLVHDAPAERAGLQVGDIVETIDDVAIAGTKGSKIMDIVHGVQPGDHLRLKVQRAGAEREVDIVAGPAK